MKIQAMLLGCLVSSGLQALVTIDTVEIGDAGNANDSTGFGGVSYTYHIGTYEVTNAQYTAFLNAVAATDTHALYNTLMETSFYGTGITRSGTSGNYSYSTIPGAEDRPVNYVSFWAAARFANWLTNGQPVGAQGVGTTETGVYNLGGVTNPVNTSISRDATAWANGGVAIASQNEWYKAAYYDPSPSGPSDDYWLYPTQSDLDPSAESPPGGTNSANYSFAAGNYTNVGAYIDSSSYYGTFDQGGNVFEWNEEVVSSSNRMIRGGTITTSSNNLRSDSSSSLDPTSEFNTIGFRVTSLQPIPEASTYVMTFSGLVLLIALFRRRPKRRDVGVGSK